MTAPDDEELVLESVEVFQLKPLGPIPDDEFEELARVALDAHDWPDNLDTKARWIAAAKAVATLDRKRQRERRIAETKLRLEQVRIEIRKEHSSHYWAEKAHFLKQLLAELEGDP